MIFNLFVLDDQNGDIRGAKTLIGRFTTLAEAKAFGLQTGNAHFSIESASDSMSQDAIVYIV